MSFTSVRPRRSRSLAAVLAGVLAFAGIVAGAPAAQAAAPTATITPVAAPALPGVNTAFTLTLTGGSDYSLAAATVALPAGYGSDLSVGSISATAGNNWLLRSSNAATKTFSVAADKGGDKLATGEVVTVSFSVTTPANSGNTTVGVTYFQDQGQNANAAGSASVSVAVGSVAQAITFDPDLTKTFGDADYTESATGGASGNPVTFTKGAGSACDITDNGDSTVTIHLTGAGSCVINADQAAGNGYTAAPQVTRTIAIAKADQTITLDPIDTQTYAPGGTVEVVASASSGLPVTLTVGGTDDCTIAGTTVTLTGAGSCTVSANQAGDADYNAAAQQQVTFSINKAGAELSLSLPGVAVTYDGNPHPVSATTTPAGLEGSVTVTYNGSTTPPTNAGSYTVEATLTHDDYTATPVSGTLVIAPKPITGSFTVADKVYDGGTDAEITGCSLPAAGIVDGDDLAIDCSEASATFGGKDVGSRTATITGAVLSGGDMGNYALSMGTATGSITAATVTAILNAGDKPYDCTTAASNYEVTLVGVIDPDEVGTQVNSAAFSSKDVGERSVTAQIELTGADEGNYVLASTSITDTSVNITRILLVGGFTAASKVYDGTTAASTAPNTLSGVVCGGVTLTVTGAQFDDKTVGTGKTVTGTLGLTGADASNYGLDPSSSSTATADITVRTVAGSFTAADKVWDGTTSATITSRDLAAASGDTGKVAGDDVSLSGGSATFDTPNVGTGKVVTGTGFSLTGADASNYVLASSTLTTTASITPLYSGKGFFAPVDMGGVFNTVKGGSTVPLKFEIFDAAGAVEQTSLSVFGADATTQAAAFKVTKLATCSASATQDAIEMVTTGGTSLRYDATGGQYIQNWKTPTVLGCYAVSVSTVDGTTVGPAYFKILK